jgi:hypothetical protein
MPYNTSYLEYAMSWCPPNEFPDSPTCPKCAAIMLKNDFKDKKGVQWMSWKCNGCHTKFMQKVGNIGAVKDFVKGEDVIAKDTFDMSTVREILEEMEKKVQYIYEYVEKRNR